MDNVLALCCSICFVCCFYRIHCNEETVAFVCPKNWLMYRRKTCILIKNELRSFDKAKETCKASGGHLVTFHSEGKETFLLNNGLVAENDYWIGLYRPLGSYNVFSWLDGGSPSDENYVNWFSDRAAGVSYTVPARCAYLDGDDGRWSSTRDCDNMKNYICQKNATCTEGRFGQNCDKFCHCHGETCDSVNGVCTYGCQNGWFGPSCDKEKISAEAVYYCFNTTSRGPHMLLRVDPLGVHYADIYGLDRDGNVVQDCRIDTFTLDSTTGVYSRVFKEDSMCGVQKTTKSKWQWKFSIQERLGVLSSNDQVLVVKCDFSKADTLRTEGVQDIQGKVETDVKDLEESKEVVKLSVVDPFTKKDMKEVEVGTFVKLSLQLVTEGDSSAKGISGYSCEAFSSDRSYTKQLTDSNGCASTSSPVSSMRKENRSSITDSFPMFAFPGFSTVNFRCNYEYCFKTDRKCQDRCQFHNVYGYRGKRSQDDVQKVTKPVYTTVRVLSRGQEQENKNVDPPEDKYRGVPLLYLNPITCSLFLFLLTVFLLYYVFFIKSLKRSVEEMKQELRGYNRHGNCPL